MFIWGSEVVGRSRSATGHTMGSSWAGYPPLTIRENGVVQEVEPDNADETAVARLSSGDVYGILRRKIVDHEIPPATKINVHGVARELGISPTPVREALRLLQGDRLVVSTSNKGYQTTPVISSDEVSDLFEFRLIIEPWAASAVTANRLTNPGAKMLADIEQMRRQLGEPNFRHLLVAHDMRFHNWLMTATGNSAVVISFEQLHFHLHLFRIDHFLMEPVGTLGEHERIAQAIFDGQPDAAEAAMREHLVNGYRRFSVRVSTARDLPPEVLPRPHFGL